MGQIYEELKPPEFQTVLMYTVGGSTLGVMVNMLAVNQGNAMVNAGLAPPSYGDDCDYVRIAIGNTVVATGENYIAYDTLMPPNHMAQWQAIGLQNGETIFVYSQKGQTSFVMTGVSYEP